MRLMWSQLSEYGLTYGKLFLLILFFFFSFLSRLMITFLKLSIENEYDILPSLKDLKINLVRWICVFIIIMQ